jgi:uncharacterized protein YbjT (DUF2867 family)
MFLVMGITGKVGGATAEHLLAHGKEVRALVRNREKAASWANQGVELVGGDWNDSAAIERALKGVEGTFVMLPAVWAPSPDYKEAKGVIENYVEALTKAAPPRVVALSSMGANRTSGLGMVTALSSHIAPLAAAVSVAVRVAASAQAAVAQPACRPMTSRTNTWVEVRLIAARSNAASRIEVATYFAIEPKPGEQSVIARSLSTVLGIPITQWGWTIQC